MLYKPEYSIAFKSWLASPLGQKFSELESNSLDSLLSGMCGYHAVILGESHFATFLQQSNVKHKVIINPNFKDEDLPIPEVCARQDKLPISSEVIDLVFMAHCLELSNNPHEVLREAHRVLRADGRVIIAMFNPYSIWGLWRFIARWRSRAPWRANYMGVVKLKDWLALLGFDIMRVNHFGFCLPFKTSTARSAISAVEKYGQRIKLPFGAAYIIEASKRIIPITPIRPVWLAEKEVAVPDDAAAPTV